MQLDFDVANLRKRQTTIELEPGLRVGEGVVAIVRTKARKPCFLTTLHAKEKGLEGFVQTTKNILQHLTVNRGKVLTNGFNISQLVGLCQVSDTFAVRGPGITTFLQARVVQLSAHVEGCLQFFTLLAIRIQAIFEGKS